MEFKEFIKQYNRMCKSFELTCVGCPINDYPLTISCRKKIMLHPEEVEKIVSKWAKEHPFKTNLDKYIEMIKEVFGKDVNKEDVRINCPITRVHDDCFKCDMIDCSECQTWWDEEYKEINK